jgi:hypothetical protein
MSTIHPPPFSTNGGDGERHQGIKKKVQQQQQQRKKGKSQPPTNKTEREIEKRNSDRDSAVHEAPKITMIVC